MTPLLEEYFSRLEYHRQQMNNHQLLLLMQVGSFYEAYEIDEPSRGCAKCISNLLRMHLTRKNGKQSNSENNPWMVGFPTYVLGKHLTKLNDEGYSVAVYDQKEDNKQERIVKGIYNYTLRYENDDEIIDHRIEPKIFSIFIERYCTTIKKKKEYRYLISINIIEMNSGKVFVYENDTDDYERDVQTIVLNYQPPEILICFQNFEKEEEQRYQTVLEQTISCKLISIKDDILFDTKISILQKIYEIDDISILGIERHNTLINLLVLTLEYIRKHDPLLITKLQYPTFIEGYTRYMHFNRDAFLELNLFSICERRKSHLSTKKQKTLFDILSNSMTNLGKRYLESILRRPLYDQKIIQERWNWIQYFTNQLKIIPSTLHFSFPDLEWYFLKWKRGKLSIKFVSQFLLSIKEMYESNYDFFSEFWKEDHLSIQLFFTEIDSLWNLLEMDSNQNFFKQPIQEMSIYMNKINQIQLELKEIESKYHLYFKLQSTNEHDYYLYSTIKKWESYQFDHKNDNHLYEISSTKSNVKLSFERLDQLSNQYKNLINDQMTYIKLSFISTSKMILDKYEKLLETIIHKISILDCYYHLALFFKKHHYSKPSISIHNEFKMDELRHPIYEIIETDQIFVPYSIHLSNQTDVSNENPLGYLIYGMNSSGKSTLLKSIGCAVWLSQCGLYVPAQTFHHSLMDGLYTKMGTYDNLFMGHSTFVAEMSELNYILKKATSSSLLLCDELTSGTETKSATGIVTSSLLYFIQHQIPFLLTTHLHSISKIQEISLNPKIKICHFEVSTSSSKSLSSLLSNNISIHYNRQLKEGSGNDIYGIEIAKTLGLPTELITMAYEYRNKIDIYIHNNKKSVKTSRYNKKLLMNECFQCQSTVDLHTHHIIPQEMFNENSISSKDGLYNLIVLCQKCHYQLHSS